MIEEDNEKELDTNAEQDPPEMQTEISIENDDKLSECEDKLQRALADYQNLERRSKIEISQKVTLKINQIMVDFIVIYEDFIRAKSALKDQGANIHGLNAVIKNMETLLSENNIKPINAIGEIFDPKLHEAVSIVEDDSLDDGTITQEVAKGYISLQDVIRPSKVIVSKKTEKKVDEDG